MTFEDALIVSSERVEDCREELVIYINDLFETFERFGFSRAEILVALADLTGQEFATLSGKRVIH
ncbi:hypothetical protein LJR255_004239 [Pararhizobium sp. LjRoot255]|uniref:hypothetical protein n=1 Tax=Pararhizobium sp. LjRoot255 TaxID=3342298 RepID=UPI003ECFDB76